MAYKKAFSVTKMLKVSVIISRFYAAAIVVSSFIGISDFV